MQELKIFENNEFGKVRTLEIDGEVWFVGKDIAKALGYSNASKAVMNHVDEEDKKFTMVDIASSQNGNVPTGQSKTAIINESGLYSLVLSSKLPSAKKFKRWITHEVIPSIRKTGSYTYRRKISALEQLQLQSQAILEVNDKIEAVQQELDDFKNDMPLLGVETDKITNAVKSKGIEVLGGKNSNAYNDNSLRTKVYQDIHREVKRQFGVNTYKAIKRNQCDKAIELIQAYEPPMYLEEQIYNTNAQMRIA